MNIYEGNLEICILCRQGAVKGDRYYVRTDTNSIATELLRKIPRYLAHFFDFLPTTHVFSTKQPDKFPFCCRICKKLLAKRENQVVNLSKVENYICLRRGSSARRIAFTSTDVTCSTPAHPSDPFTCTISPIAFPTTCTSSSSDDQVPTGHEHHKDADKIESQVPPECGVKVVVTWPSQVKTRKLKTVLEPLGKALINGTWSNIAGAVFRVKELRVELCKFFLKEIGKECCAMVSKKNLSLLRKTSATEMQSLSLVNISNELKTRCPLLYSVLMTAGTTGRKKSSTQSWLPGVVVAASVVLKQRCRDVNAVQLMIATLIKYTGFHTMCKFLSALRLGVSPSFYNKKSDVLGLLCNAEMLKQKKDDESVLMSCFGEDQTKDQNLPVTSQPQVSESQTVDGGTSIGTPVSESVNTVVAAQQSGIGQSLEHNIPCVTQTQVSQGGAGVSIETPVVENGSTVVAAQQIGGQDEEQNIPCVSQAQISQGGGGGVSIGTLVSENGNTGVAVRQSTIGPGWKIAFDNIDIYQRVREMTEENQNKDLHWVNHVKITNRVSGNHLPDDKPTLNSVMTLDNCKVIPSVPDHISQRVNYIVLIERILTEEIACLSFCTDVVAGHIPHRHSRR
ncbi:uncharacterized protein [Acropora muricata]|uniref:uncharacterized protein isoform X1 n=1 Tax=Acropora muricata TaxID=159855 RepID=UPI0034E386A4